MKVLFKQAYHCRHGHDHKRGDTCELPDHVAVKLFGFGIAEAVREAPVERAVKAPPEKTTRTTKPKTKARRSSSPAKEEAE